MSAATASVCCGKTVASFYSGSDIKYNMSRTLFPARARTIPHSRHTHCRLQIGIIMHCTYDDDSVRCTIKDQGTQIVSMVSSVGRRDVVPEGACKDPDGRLAKWSERVEQSGRENESSDTLRLTSVTRCTFAHTNATYFTPDHDVHSQKSTCFE